MKQAINSIRNVLEGSQYFKAFPPSFLDWIIHSGRTRRYSPNQLVCTADERLKDVWIVLRGGLRVSFADRDGHDHVLAILGPGSFVGLGTVIEGTVFAADVHSHGATELLAINGAQLLAELDRNPRLWRPVAAIMNYRVRLLMETFAGIAEVSLAQRLARILLGHMHHLGTNSSSEQAVRLAFSQSDLASMLKCSRTRVSAVLARLKQDKLIEVGYRMIVVRDRGRLTRLAGTDVLSF